MANENALSSNFSNLKINEGQDINILLLGETGVGKSTFINAIANYFHFKSFRKALKAQELLVLIPSIITVTDENLAQKQIKIGSDKNEFQEIGAAGTQDVKTYVFPIGAANTRLRLIDSPGMGDPRGIDQDDLNCENILSYLSQLKELHAICFLMKPTTTRITVFFDYCIKQILSRLDKSASRNIIFIFTNTRGTDYTPGDTLPCLKTVIDGVSKNPPNVTIPLKDNVFSVDNEAFRFLVAMKQNVKFSDTIQQRFLESWNSSSKECRRLISYIVGDVSQDALKPHQLINTISINEARRIIVQLAQPLADISQLIHDNIRILERHQVNLRAENQSLNDLKGKLFIPVMNLQVIQLTQPATICTSPKCAEMIKVGEIQKWHYRQRCHDPCYLTNVSKEIIGDPNLVNCAAMSNRMCIKCTCEYLIHMHVYYMSTTFQDKIEDSAVRKNISRREEALAESRRLINQIDQRKRELEEEREFIIQSTAQFSNFLQSNAITPFNDSYKGYIEYLVMRERSLGRHGDPEVVANLEQLLCRYEAVKDALDQSFKYSQVAGMVTSVTSITADKIMKTINALYQMKHNGKKISELLKKQKASRKFEHEKSCEYVHPKSSDMDVPKKKEKNKKKEGKEKNTKTNGSSDDKKNKLKDNKSDRNVSQKSRNFVPSNNRQQPNPIRPLFPERRELPPPYEPPPRPAYNSQHENVSVTVDINPKRNHRDEGRNHYDYPEYRSPYPNEGRRHYDHNYRYPSHDTTRSYPDHYPPPERYPPHHAPYPSHSGHYPPPHQEHRAPPQGYYPPPPPHDYYPPPQRHYAPPPPPPPNARFPENNHHNHGQFQRNPQGYKGNRGRGNFNQGRGRGKKRSNSQPRKGNKSGAESKTCSSDSSSD